jgi:hypothetical protein
VAPSDWAICHPVVGPYSTVNTQSTTQSTCTVNYHVNVCTVKSPTQSPAIASILPIHPAMLASIQPPVIHAAMFQPVIGLPCFKHVLPRPNRFFNRAKPNAPLCGRFRCESVFRLGAHLANSPCVAFGHPPCELALRCV